MQEHDAKTSLNNPGGEQVMTQAGGKDAGLPFFAFLDEKGETIVNSIRPGPEKGGNIGHPVQSYEVDWFLEMLNKAAPDMSADEAKILENWLRNQKKN